MATPTNNNTNIIHNIASFDRASLRSSVTQITKRDGSVLEEKLTQDGSYQSQETQPSGTKDLSYLNQPTMLPLDPNLAWKAMEASQQFLRVPTVQSRDSLWNTPRSDCTRIVCMSDTHGLHRDIAVPKGDLLIHGGDFTQTGEVKMVQDMTDYFRELGFSQTVCIAGNHDLTLDLAYYERAWRRFHKRKKLNAQDAKQSMQQLVDETVNSATSKFHYLEDSSCIIPTKNGASLSVYGSPWSPEFYDWAFNVPRGPPSLEIWSKIPTETDILVTHGPPLGRGDLCDHGGRAGCSDLLQQVQERVKPRLMVYGHIHEGYGATFDGTTLFVNASNLDLEYDNVHPCTVIDLPHDPNQPPRIVQPHCDLKAEELQPWFRQNGYTVLADVLEKGVDQLPFGNDLLQTPKAYQAILKQLKFSTYKELNAKGELRKALLQLHAESF